MIKQIIDYIMQKFGYTRKQESIKEKDYSLVTKTSYTTIFAKKLANKSLSDSKCEVVGTSDRAKLLNEALDYIKLDLTNIVTAMLGLGGVVVVPYVDDNKIYFKTVNQDCLVLNRVAGDKITDCTLIADRFDDTNGNIFYRNIRYAIENETLSVYTFVTKNGTEVPLDSVAEWAGISELIIIQGVNAMPFAYFKCPQDSKGNVDFKGVSITYGCDSTIEEIHEVMQQIRDEYGEKEVKTYIDDVLLDKNQKLSKRYVKITGSGQGDGAPIEVYSPEIRDVSFFARIDKLFAHLENEVGVNHGILTKYESGDRTAFEIKANQGDTFAMIGSIRVRIERGLQDYINACDFLSNYYRIARFGDWELVFDWGNLMIEDTAQTFQQLMQAESVGALERAEIRQFIFNKETLEESRKRVKEIAEAEPTVRDMVGLNA